MPRRRGLFALKVTEHTTPGLRIGVDGCRAGWLAVAIGTDDRHTLQCFATIRALWHTHPTPAAILIDIPIGLASKNGRPRTVDGLARGILKPRRHASVFTPPCREALAAETYEDACRINQAVSGRKIALQTWHIMPKIKEVDDFLGSHPEAVGIVRETHPEIGFWSLAGGEAMRHPKRTAAGRAERLAVLQRAWPPSRDIYTAARKRFPRREAAPDDILDALANAVTARRSRNAGRTLPDHPARDERNLPMEMVYVDPAEKPLP